MGHHIRENIFRHIRIGLKLQNKNLYQDLSQNISYLPSLFHCLQLERGLNFLPSNPISIFLFSYFFSFFSRLTSFREFLSQFWVNHMVLFHRKSGSGSSAFVAILVTCHLDPQNIFVLGRDIPALRNCIWVRWKRTSPVFTPRLYPGHFI